MPKPALYLGPMYFSGGAGSQGVIGMRPAEFTRLKPTKIWWCGVGALHKNGGVSQAHREKWPSPAAPCLSVFPCDWHCWSLPKTRGELLNKVCTTGPAWSLQKTESNHGPAGPPGVSRKGPLPRLMLNGGEELTMDGMGEGPSTGMLAAVTSALPL